MPISKSLRFDIFRRDKFTCQYCGRRPPDVVLEVDHIAPVSRGGDDDPSNLITSCYECNRGKGTKTLVAAVQPPDLDLDYLEAEQRLAELQRYQQTKRKLNKAIEKLILTLQYFFQEQIKTSWAPEAQSFRRLLYYHDPEQIEKAIVLSSGQSQSSSPSEKWKYACAILRNWHRGQDDA